MAIILRAIDAFRIYELALVLSGQIEPVLGTYIADRYLPPTNDEYTAAAASIVLFADHHGLHRPVPALRRAPRPGGDVSAATNTTTRRVTPARRAGPPKRRDRLDPILKVAFPFWVVGTVFLVLFPVYLIFMVSFAPGSALFGDRPPLVITEFTVQWWDRVIAGGDLIEPLIKSLTVATVSTVVAVAIAAPAAYVISRLPSALAYTIVVALLVTRMFPEFTIGISVATWFARFGLIDSYVGLVLAHLIGALPFIAWILVGTFETVPRDLEEAAHIDGASRLSTLLRVVFPVAAPGIAVASLFVWLYSWNEFLYARLLTTNQNTLPLQVFQAIDRGNAAADGNRGCRAHAPILLVVYFLQRYLKPGALSGSGQRMRAGNRSRAL